MVKYDFFHSAHGGLINGDNDDLQLNYNEPVKLNLYNPINDLIGSNKKVIFTIKSKSIIGTTTESGLDTNQIIDQGLTNEFIQKFVEYLRFTIKNNMIEKVEVWDKKSRKRSKWNTFYGIDDHGQMINKKIPNIKFNYNTNGDFNTGIVKLDISENSINPISEWIPLDGIQDFNKQFTPISEEETSMDEMSDDSFNSINQDGTMMPMMGGSDDVGYLHFYKSYLSLLSCIYSMLPKEEYNNKEDLEINIYNSTCLYYKEEFDTTEKKGIMKLLSDFPDWSKIYIISGDLLYELRESIHKINDDIEKLRNVQYYIESIQDNNTSIINDMLYKILYDILLKEGKLKDKSFIETIMMVHQFINDDSDYIINELGPKITEILKSYSEEELIKHAKKYDIIDNDYKDYKEEGRLYYKIVSENMITLEEVINEYNLLYKEFTDILIEIKLSEYKDDASLVNIIQQRYNELLDDLKNYTNRLKIIKELKMLDFAETNHLGRKNKKSIRVKTGRSGSRMSRRRRRSGVKN